MDLLIFIVVVMLVIFAIFKIVEVKLYKPYMETLADIYGLRKNKKESSGKLNNTSNK